MLTIASITDPGLIRTNNEDFYVYSKEKRIIVVADGIGGYAYGEVASRIAVDSCYALLESELDDLNTDNSTPEEVLTKAIKFANTKVLDAKVGMPAYKKMGTTLSCVYVDDSFLYYSYVGDSRIYLISPEARRIQLLTLDHTLSRELIDKTLAPELHKHSNNILTRSVGAGLSVNPDHGKHPIDIGDYILACTDGLTDLVSQDDIITIILANKDSLKKALEKLVDQVKEQGARDNITIILARCT